MGDYHCNVPFCCPHPQIFQHLRHTTVKDQQVWIVRILFIIPIYGLCSWLGLWIANASVYFDAVRGCYEGRSICVARSHPYVVRTCVAPTHTAHSETTWIELWCCWCHLQCKVTPLCASHSWDGPKRPDYRGVLISQVVVHICRCYSRHCPRYKGATISQVVLYMPPCS